MGVTRRLRRAIAIVAFTGMGAGGDCPGGLRRCRPESAYLIAAGYPAPLGPRDPPQPL
jgi:hypothetical protein